ncbi:cell growth regulator with RING finger domain protein 1 [Scleropages formosus]|uniref:cell growth regulator with RING finger domain protein 1 n=1 Tax=Scleropages formosus TaxID=113540 RepID=UPI0010FABE37|nr:cell growth regulator with RING finger domain protein 1 [Scleropages formosus]
MDGFDMAALFLKMLYEYCPPFYISLVFLCFIVTAAVVLLWFRIDVPVILRSSDDADLLANIPEKRMVQVINPFALELGSAGGSLTEGVALRPRCLEDCVLSVYWGCSIHGLQSALQAHQHGPPLSTPQRFQTALHFQYQHLQTFHVCREDTEERFTQMPAELGVWDFGPQPRTCYPLVALLTLAQPEVRNEYNVVSSVTVIHVPDNSYRLSTRVLFQYLLTSQGSMYELKPLFMSTEDGGQSEPLDLGINTEEEEEEEKEEKEEEKEKEEEEEEEGREHRASPGTARDCVVCQNAPVNRVLLPCRHTCLCDSCLGRVQHCPMCRAFVLESFALTQVHPATEAEWGD